MGGKAGICHCQVGGRSSADLSGGLGRWQKGRAEPEQRGGLKGFSSCSDPWAILHPPRDIAHWRPSGIETGLALERCQVLPDGRKCIETRAENAWQPQPRAEPGLSCARKLAAKQK